MNFSFDTYHKPQTICVKIKTKSPQKISLKIVDFDNLKTCFSDLKIMINGEKEIQIPMPITSKKCLLSVSNFANGNLKEDDSFVITEKDITRIPLQTRYDVVGLENKKIRYFLNFAQNFCYHASYLEPNKKGEHYKSSEGKFFIEYLPQINGNDGYELNTPARTNKETGVIQISKKSFYHLTVPERMAIILHEFSHFYLNENIDDESEADLNGLLIYLGLGYPREEANSAWIEVFLGAQTPENAERYKLIQKFITDFKNFKI